MNNKFFQTLFLTAFTATGMITMQACTDTKGANQTIPKSTEPVPVKVVMLERSAAHSTIKISGQLSTDDETALGFKTGGIVDRVFVKEGDAVKKGQLLATLDLTEINALVAQARHGLEKAQRDFDRAKNLYKDSVATLEQLQNAETGLALAKEQLQAAAFNRSYSEIHAPASGFVLKKFVNPGQVVGVGDPIVLTNGASAGNWILKTGVSDKQWSSIKLNSVATIVVDAFPNKTFEGIVTRKSGAADVQTGAFTLEISVKAGDVKFARGMFGAAEIAGDEKQMSWSVPYEAVLDANGNDGFVFITKDNKTAIKQPVIIDSFDGNAIRISKGLEDASALIISGSAYLSDNSPITILK